MTLRKTRRTFAAIFFVLLTLLLLDFTGTLHQYFGWMAKLQFLPALLSLHAGVIAILIIPTLLFGRIYCSVICPLGVFQDLVSRGSRVVKKKKRFSFSPAKTWLRYGFLAIAIVAFALGVGSIVALFDPYGAYGRFVNNLFLPIYQGANNILAYFAERMDSYAFYTVDIWMKSISTFLIAAFSFVAIGWLAWRYGRTYCNTVCPVGTILGFLSRFSLFRLTFDEEKCTKCGKCERSCKASCIDSKHTAIDLSRCVACFNCIEKCNFGAIKYAPRRLSGNRESKESEGVTRKSFLSVTGLFLLGNTLKAQQLKVDGGLADIEDKKRPDRKVPIVPAGSEGHKNFYRHCIGCQLCVTVCPNQILRPSGNLQTLMQPEMSYERGFCRPECTECAKVCPPNAIKGITAADKSAISIGYAVWIKENCLVNRDEITCTACERHCPTKAITLVSNLPTINKELCIGCGACEYHCPARPFSAIYVEGNVKHHSI